MPQAKHPSAKPPPPRPERKHAPPPPEARHEAPRPEAKREAPRPEPKRQASAHERKREAPRQVPKAPSAGSPAKAHAARQTPGGHATAAKKKAPSRPQSGGRKHAGGASTTKASTRAVAHDSAASLQQRVYEMCQSQHVTDRVLRAVFLLCTAENDWNTETCNSSGHCGLFQLDRDWQRQHNYRDIGYWLQFALDHGFYGHGGLKQIDRDNPGYTIGGIVQACQGAGPTWDAAVAYYNSRLHESDAILAKYRSRPAPALPPRQLYFNPLARAKVRGERIDQGVDYAGTGELVAIADANISSVFPGGWAPYGNYMEYKITQPGPLNGVYIYYAEGIEPTVSYGEHVKAGQVVARIIPGWRYGMELGFAAGDGHAHTYYAYHDGAYREGTATRPGVAFDNLVRRLGGPRGVQEGPVVGKFPEYVQSGEFSGAITSQPETPSGPGGPGEAFNAPGAASVYTWPGDYHSAIIQLQRGIGQGAHHSHAAWHHYNGIEYVKQAD